jgi:hypothetical protein
MRRKHDEAIAMPRLTQFAIFLCLAAFNLAAVAQSTVALNTAEVFCTSDPRALSNAAPGTIRMATLLARLAREARPTDNTFLNQQRAAGYTKMLSFVTDPKELLEVRMQIGLEYLNAGETPKAIQAFADVEKTYANVPGLTNSKIWADMRHLQAVAYLRLGEQDNCLNGHTADSCLFPIQGGGVHKLQSGSRKAIEILEEQLNRVPQNRRGAWLLNLAYMTLGEYPDKVPTGWRLPPEVFRSEYDLKRFPDVAGNLGLDVNDLAGGTITEDFDGDGDLDIMMSTWSLLHPIHYFRNNGDGTFTDRTIEAGLAILTGGLNIVPGDFNNDGLVDVLVLRGAWMGVEGHHPDSLLRNDGNGHFTDVTEEAGLMVFNPNQTAVWFDYNSDGWLDIYFGYESLGEHRYGCKLFRNNRNGRFTECAVEAGVAGEGFVKAVVSADYNNDGRPDLYLSRRGQPNILYRNDGPAGTNTSPDAPWKFTDVSAAAGVEEPIVSFPAWFFDYDNDGWQDIFVSGYGIKDVGDVAADYMGYKHNAETARLYRNNGNGTFSNVTAAARLNRVLHTMGCNYGDFDNDGWLDFYLGTGDPSLANLMPNRAFRNAGSTARAASSPFFQDVTTAAGMGHLQKGHGVSFADLDHDGDQDIYHSVGGAYEGDFYRNALFENPGHGNHWITLKLEGVKENRLALGARIKVVVTDSVGRIVPDEPSDKVGQTVSEVGRTVPGEPRDSTVGRTVPDEPSPDRVGRTVPGEPPDPAERSIHRVVSSGSSFGNNPFRQEIGLGQAKAIKRVEIFWPVTGKTQVLEGLEMDRFYRVRENESKAELWNLPKFKFSRTPPAGHTHQHTQNTEAIGPVQTGR